MTQQDDERNTETMGRRLASLRHLKGLTQDEVAGRIGTSQAYLSQLENDDAARPAVVIIERLATLYGASLDYVVRGSASTAA